MFICFFFLSQCLILPLNCVDILKCRLQSFKNSIMSAIICIQCTEHNNPPTLELFKIWLEWLACLGAAAQWGRDLHLHYNRASCLKVFNWWCACSYLHLSCPILQPQWLFSDRCHGLSSRGTLHTLLISIVVVPSISNHTTVSSISLMLLSCNFFSPVSSFHFKKVRCEMPCPHAVDPLAHCCHHTFWAFYHQSGRDWCWCWTALQPTAMRRLIKATV